MDKRRLISIAIAILVAVLIMNLGKSCTEDIVEANKKAKKDTTTVHYNYAPDNGNGGNDSPVIDETVPVIEEATEHIEYITSILGEIIGTVAPTESVEDITLPEEELIQPTTKASILNNPDPVEPATSPYSILGNESTPQEATQGNIEEVYPTESPNNQQQATIAKDFVIKLE